MKHDEFAFFSEQLGHMVREGIPLEGALEQLARDMHRGSLRAEVTQLAEDLTRGASLEEALQRRQLPGLCAEMLVVGARGNNLPAVLSMLADHYRQAGAVWTRLKGLLFYPVLVLALSLGFAIFFITFLFPPFQEFLDEMRIMNVSRLGSLRVMAPPVILSCGLLALMVAWCTPALRRTLRWRISPFRDASLAQLASAVALMLRGGCRLPEAIALLRHMEEGTPAAADLARMQKRLAEGETEFTEMTRGAGVLPPLFVWMVTNGGEDMARGFERAAELYHTRAQHRTEMLLYAALPCSIVVLGAVLMMQMSAVFTPLVTLMQSIGQ